MTAISSVRRFIEAAGERLACEVNADDTPQRLVIWKTGAPVRAGELPADADFTRTTQPAALVLTSEPAP